VENNFTITKLDQLSSFWMVVRIESLLLDHFIQKKMFLVCIKLFSLVRTIQNPDCSNKRTQVFRCPVPAKIDHSKSGLFWFLEGHCTLLNGKETDPNLSCKNYCSNTLRGYIDCKECVHFQIFRFVLQVQ
jgi:hypothetical protein